MSSDLTIRNLSSVTLVLRDAEHFEDPNSKQTKASTFQFGSKGPAPAAPSASQLEEHTQSFSHQDLNVSLSPFESYTWKPATTPNDATESLSSHTTIRFTVEATNGQRYRIDTNPSYTQKSSRKLTPLGPNPSYQLAAIYHPSKPSPHLTIHTNDSVELSTWMSKLSSSLPLSSLSIPGTHNSHTCYRALPSVRCQIVSVKDQLESGIRFLDIRVQPSHATDPSSTLR